MSALIPALKYEHFYRTDYNITHTKFNGMLYDVGFFLTALLKKQKLTIHQYKLKNSVHFLQNNCDLILKYMCTYYRTFWSGLCFFLILVI